MFFHCENDSAVTQANQEDCGVSILGDVKNLTGHGPGQTAGTAWLGALDQTTLRGPFNPLTFCKSMSKHKSERSEYDQAPRNEHDISWDGQMNT